jgi:hypothetical protein
VGQQSAVASAALNLTVEDPENLAVIEFGVMSVVKPVKEEVMLFIKGGVHKIGKLGSKEPFFDADHSDMVYFGLSGFYSGVFGSSKHSSPGFGGRWSDLHFDRGSGRSKLSGGGPTC